MSKFQYVDFAAHFQKGFRNRVVAIREIPTLVKSFDFYGCYSTYFFYSDEIISYMEAHRMTEDKASVSGYEGKVWAPEFPIDIDHADRLISLEAA
ncbi:MAG: hypothetical protein PHN49_11610, partial [Candidatus Omnitrophica bacterium]|nr:hypothetical protein [Candidatus Omnitrophota bacterium]